MFLFDEPLSNLDAKLRTQMRIELQKLHREINATMIYVTHDQTEAMTLGNRIAVLSKGRLLQLDTPLHLYNYPANKFVAGFIGSPSMNFLKGSLQYRDGFYFIHEAVDCTIFLGKDIPESIQNYTGKAIQIGIRPEHITICEEEITGDCHLTVTAFENMGNEQLVYFTLGNQNIIARRPPVETQDIGMQKSVFFNKDKIVFIDELTGDIISL